jgi:hypothetical protein
MGIKVFLLCFMCTILSIGCKEINKERKLTSLSREQLFRLPEIPNEITDPQERAGYLAEHYWDYLNFTDTSLIRKLNIIEPIFADYIGVLPHATYSEACKGIRKVMTQVTVNPPLFIYFTRLADKYLYDVDSPVRNDEFYIPFLKSIIESKIVDESHKIRFCYQLSMVLKNRPDSIATDFIYMLASGKRTFLSKIGSEYTLLFFNNPDCGLCGDVREKIIASQVLSNLQHPKDYRLKKLAILSIYTEDDFGLWKSHLWKSPSDWICGYDKQMNIRNRGLYDLRKIPALYLLNREKRVLLKNTSVEAVEEYFVKQSFPYSSK